MPSIFLSHTSLDKPFVEKLARDLKRIGINVWFDKWEIKIGDSITWKIEEGIRENEFLGIVLSPEALSSEWVKSEIGAAWVKQINTKKIIVLPIFYRECNIPYFLADRRFADFRTDYNSGFRELASIFGIEETETITQDNWRRFTKYKKANWKQFKIKEFEELVTVLVDRAVEFNWSTWVGGTTNPFSITLTASTKQSNKSLSIKLSGETNSYLCTFKDTWNPNHLKAGDFDIYIGNTVDACEEYAWRVMSDFNKQFGVPEGKAQHMTERFSRGDEIIEATTEMLNNSNWYKGKNLIR